MLRTTLGIEGCQVGSRRPHCASATQGEWLGWGCDYQSKAASMGAPAQKGDKSRPGDHVISQVLPQERHLLGSSDLQTSDCFPHALFEHLFFLLESRSTN